MAGRFGSVVTAMVTPFRKDHGVDLDGAQEFASWLTDNGSDSVFVVGSTGESPTLSHHEKADLFRVVGDAIRGRGKLICGTGTYSTAETLELTQAAEDAGADGIVVVTPYYNKPPQRGLSTSPTPPSSRSSSTTSRAAPGPASNTTRCSGSPRSPTSSP
jgi:4-hydroxy-tetrahydrodipicolinate synthase